MKTLCFTLGLLLLITCCSCAMREAMQINTAPGKCCFTMCPRKVAPKFILNITKTHSSCPQPAFIVHTVKGRQICYSQKFPWAVKVYNQFYNTEGSSQQS